MRRCENEHRIRGFMGNDPKIKELRGGGIKVSFSVATKVSWKDKDTGEWKDKTEWHQCEGWDFIAERVAKWFRKGYYVVVEGPVETHTWKKDGIDHEMRVIRVDNCSLCEKLPFPEPLEGYVKPEEGAPPDFGGNGGSVDEDTDLPFGR